MTTFLDLLGLGFRPRIVFDSGGDGGGGGDSRPDSAKALDETGGTSVADAYQQYADTMAEAGVRNLAGAGTSAYEQAQALAGRDDDDDEPSFPVVVGDTVGFPDPSIVEDVVLDPTGSPTGFSVPDEFYRDIMGFDVADNQPSGMFQGPTLDADIDPLGLDSVGAFTPIDVPEISDINLEFGDISSTDTRPVADTRPFTTFDDLMGGGDDLVGGSPAIIEDTSPSLADPFVPSGIGGEGFGDEPPLIDMQSVTTAPGFPQPEILTQRELFETGQIGRSDVIGGAAIPAGDMTTEDYLAATGLTSTLAQGRDPTSPNAAESALISDVLNNSNITMDSDRQARIVETMRDNGATGAEIENFLRENPEGSELYSGDGSFGANLRNVADDVLSYFVKSATFGLIDPKKMNFNTAQRFLDAYRDTGKFVYDAENPDVVIGVEDSDGNLVRGFGEFQNTESGAIRVQDVADMGGDDEGDDGCPSGFVRNPVTGVCEPIDDDVGEAPPISVAPRPVRPRDPSPAPDLPDPVDPGDGMIIRQPTFATGGIVGYQRGGDVDAESYDFSPFQETGFGTGDTTLMQRHKLGLDTFDDNQMNMYDLNNDGMVDQTDIDAGFQFITGNPDLNVMQQRAIRERDPTPIRSKDPLGDPVPTSPAAPAQGMSIRSVGFQEGGPVTPNIDNFLRTFRG